MRKLSCTIGVLLGVLVLQVVPTDTASAGNHWNRACYHESIVNFWEESITGTALKGRASLCTTPKGMWSSMKVKGLTKGNAYTIWMIYIDDPASCANFPLPSPDVIPFPEPAGFAGACGLADFFTEDPSGAFLNPLVVFGRMDSVVAGHGKHTRFSGELRSFQPTPGAQVWMLVMGHGPANESDNRELARQLLTPEDPLSGTPHVGIEGRPFGYPAGVVVFNVPD